MKKTKVKKGMPVIIKHREYRSLHYGIVTEVFASMVQIFGVDDYDGVGYHEYESENVACTPCEKERVKFAVDQAVKEIERKKISAEIKFNQLKADHEEVLADIAKFFP